MSASVVKTAAVRPAANCPPSPRFADVISATAPTPSASVDTPTSVVSNPHTMKRTPRRSTCGAMEPGLWASCQGSSSGGSDGDADFNADERRIRRLQTEAQAGAVRHAGRYGDAHRMIKARFAGATAQTAGLGPRFPAAAAVWTGGANRHFDGDDETAARFTRRERDFGVKEAATFAFCPLAEK